MIYALVCVANQQSFYEFARAVEEIQPKYYLLENVIPKQKADENIITAKLGGGKSCDDKFCGLFRTREKNVYIGRIFPSQICQNEIPLCCVILW